MYKNVIEGRGGSLGCLFTHCVECAHCLLHCLCKGEERGVLFHGWIRLTRDACSLLGVVMNKGGFRLLGAEMCEIDCWLLVGKEEV